MTGRVLVAGIGNIFLGDDGFGVAVAQRLAREELPDHVKVMDIGIRGVHLAYELLEDYEVAIFVDAMPLDADPGTVKLVEPEPEPPNPDVPPDAHRMDPQAVFDYLSTLGGTSARVLLVGCQPSTISEGIGLSPQVEAAIEESVALIKELVADPARTRQLKRSA
ncbi:MAG: hydrogenase maturation protease [Candidatus Limnocylindria bacterium]